MPGDASHDNTDDLLARERSVTTRGASELLCISTVTLEQWRRKGEGPRFWRIGTGRGSTIRYRVADLIAWRDARTCGKRP